MIPSPAITTRRRSRLLWLAGLVGVMLAGSAGAQDATTIARARDALEAARSTRAVRALAATELDAAERALERATAARDAGQAEDEVSHLAHLAEQRAAIARLRAEQRRVALTLASLSETHALLAEARALEVAAAKQRALELAQRLKRFDVRENGHGLLLTPRERWFDTGLMPTWHAARAIAEAARLLAELLERQAVVQGYAMREGLPHGAMQSSGAASGAVPMRLAAKYQESVTPGIAADRDDIGCVRADVVRAFLISNGVDPRRIVATCIAPQDALEASAQPGVLPAGETAIAIMPENGASPAPTNEQAGPGSTAQ
jgi:OmpA-OmpF porin, OOP family